MLLGTLIMQAVRAQGEFAAELTARDPLLGARLAAEAARLNEVPEEFIADTVRRFMAAEDAESWTTVMSSIQRAEDPGTAFLEAVLRTRLSHQCSH